MRSSTSTIAQCALLNRHIADLTSQTLLFPGIFTTKWYCIEHMLIAVASATMTSLRSQSTGNIIQEGELISEWNVRAAQSTVHYAQRNPSISSPPCVEEVSDHPPIVGSSSLISNTIATGRGLTLPWCAYTFKGTFLALSPCMYPMYAIHLEANRCSNNRLGTSISWS